MPDDDGGDEVFFRNEINSLSSEAVTTKWQNLKSCMTWTDLFAFVQFRVE